MIDLLSSLVNTVVLIVNFFINAIQTLIDFISKIPTFISFLTSAIGLLPNVFIGFLAASISIYAIFFIIDR